MAADRLDPHLWLAWLRTNRAEAAIEAAHAHTPDGQETARLYVQFMDLQLPHAERAAVDQLHLWLRERTVLRFLGARPLRIITDVRGCRRMCPRWEDSGQECIAVVDLAELSGAGSQILNVHLVPGELAPAGNDLRSKQ